MPLAGFRARPGMNLIEVLVAAVVAGIVMLALGGYITANLTGNQKEKDRTFAAQKALQILEEIAAEDTDVNPLGPDKYQKESFSYRLTIQDVPDHAPLSGNVPRNGIYKFVRQVESLPVAGDPFGRKVTVKLWYQDPKSSTPQPLGKPLAVVSNVLRSNVSTVGPKQVIDVYAISIENIPHALRNGSNLVAPSATEARASFSKALNTIKSANPGLDFRVRYISRLSVGRDSRYRPYMNEDKPVSGSGRDALDYAYFYPGKLTSTDNRRFYDLSKIKGHLKVDFGALGMIDWPGVSTYALADQWNHAVRYYEEFDDTGSPKQVPNAVYGGDESPLSLRQFLEDMLQDTTNKYRNAVIANLHGDVFPVIPLRSYSDASKDNSDDDASGAVRRRVATHPYKLNFNTATDTVRLLVHGYTSTGGNEGSYPAYARKAKIILKDIWPHLDPNYDGSSTLTVSDVVVDRYYRDFNMGGQSQWKPDVNTSTATRTQVGNDLEIELNNLSYDSRMSDWGGNKTGIKSDSLDDYGLYRLQYFPDPYLAHLDSIQGSNWRPRNTAKYVIRFKLLSTATRKHYRVVTKLAKDALQTLGFYEPTDSADPSVTNTWFYLDRTWDAGKGRYTDIPWTDQVQLVGDPRHVPYLDAHKRGLYNRYHSDFTSSKEVYKELVNSGTDYTKYLLTADANSNAGLTDVDPGGSAAYSAAFPDTANDWNDAKVDMPTYLAMWREALLRNNAMFVNVAGNPLKMIGLGGEFALDNKVYDTDIKAVKNPWDPDSTSDAGGDADELFSDKTTIPEQYDDSWAAKPWIGELYPHHKAASWETGGNLPIDNGSSDFKRRRISQVKVWDKFADKTDGNNKKLLSGEGAFATLLNGLASGSTDPLDVITGGGNDRGAIQGAGTQAFQFLRVTAPGSAYAPHVYKLTGGTAPAGWDATSSNHGLLEWLHAAPSPGPYYKGKNSGEYASYPIVLTGNTSSDTRKAYFLASSFRPANVSDLSNVMTIGATSMVAAYFDATRQTAGVGDHNIKPQPRAKMIKPRTNEVVTGSSVGLEWYARYIKADGQQYSPFTFFDANASATNGAPLELVFYVKFKDTTTPGAKWTSADITFPGGAGSSASVSMATDVSVAPGSIPTAAGVNPIPMSTLVAGPPAYYKQTATWNVAGFTDGDYLLRVEAYRKVGSNVIPIQYAYHEIPIKIDH